eukprot:GHVU01083325.1.p1 GENE.GHVU01083325.1~~GHVU01083325.1.p1  ORF type:complete len:114 (+),score=0.63 GHVU01083325.1:52-393(+)
MQCYTHARARTYTHTHGYARTHARMDTLTHMLMIERVTTHSPTHALIHAFTSGCLDRSACPRPRSPRSSVHPATSAVRIHAHARTRFNTHTHTDPTHAHTHVGEYPSRVLTDE